MVHSNRVRQTAVVHQSNDWVDALWTGAAFNAPLDATVLHAQLLVGTSLCVAFVVCPRRENWLHSKTMVYAQVDGSQETTEDFLCFRHFGKKAAPLEEKVKALQELSAINFEYPHLANL